MDQENAQRQRRGADRRPFLARAFAVDSTHDTELLVTDISYAGCQLRAEGLKQGENLQLLVLRRGTVAAEIRWATNDRAGVRFVD